MRGLESVAREAEEIAISLEIPLEFAPDLAVMVVGRVQEIGREMLRPAGLRIPSRAKSVEIPGEVRRRDVRRPNPFARALSRGGEETPILAVIEPSAASAPVQGVTFA